MAAREQTSARVSKIAGKVLKATKGLDPRAGLFLMRNGPNLVATVGDLKTLAASALTQDEKPKRKSR